MTSCQRRLAVGSEGSRSARRPARPGARAARDAGCLLAAALTAALWAWHAAPAVPAAADDCPGNLLANGGFENGFSGRGRLAETVALGWSAWYERFPGTNGINYVPDYSPGQREAGSGDGTVAEGRWSQELATLDATHTAGLWQRVAVPFEGALSARVAVRAWASDGDSPDRSEPPGTYVSSLGLDPGGGVDPYAATVVWTAPISVTDAWVPLSLRMQVPAGMATLYLRGQPTRPLRHNVSRWDDACVQVVPMVDGVVPEETPRPWTGPDAPSGLSTAASAPSETPDPATQVALDVGLFLDLAATEPSAPGPTVPGPAGGTAPSPPGAAPVLPSALSDGPTAPELAPWGLQDDAWAEGEDSVSSGWLELRAVLADRAGVLFLGLAAVIAGLWLGRARRDRGAAGGDE